MTSIPCIDCIDGISPYDPATWGYVYEIPSTSTAGYNIASNTPAAQKCGSSGDMNLGIIPARCVSPPKFPPVSITNVPYVNVRGDCGESTNRTCIGPALGLGECVLPSGQKTSYGLCGPGSEHQWYARDWITEMNKPGPAGSGFETMQDYCCFLPPGNLPNGQPRSTWCPPNLWYGSSQCQTPAANQCSNDPSSSWDAGCDAYVQQNLQTAVGKPQFAQGLFLTTVAGWANQFSSSSSTGTGETPSPTDPFVATILKWAPSFPGMLAPSLTTACANVTRDQIGNDTTGNLGKLCACYLQPEQYYLPGVIPKECDSLCSLAGTTGGIPLYQWGNTGIPTIKTCEQTTCVIDNVTLQYANTVSGNMNWSQVCGKCDSTSGAGCTCVINGINVDSVDSNIPGVNINQECGTFATANGGIAPPVTASVESFWVRYRYLLWSGLALGLGLLAFLLIRRIR